MSPAGAKQRTTGDFVAFACSARCLSGGVLGVLVGGGHIDPFAIIVCSHLPWSLLSSPNAPPTASRLLSQSHLEVCLLPAVCIPSPHPKTNPTTKITDSQCIATPRQRGFQCSKLRGSRTSTTCLQLLSNMPPITPQHARDDFPTFLASIVQQYGVEIPFPQNYSPISLSRLDGPAWRVLRGLRALYFKSRARLDDVLANFDEWITGRTITARQPQGLKRGAQRGSMEPEDLSDEEKDRRLMYLKELVDDAMWFLDNNAALTSKRVSKNPTENVPELVPKRRRLSDEDEDEFHTAPGSPVKPGTGGQSAPLDLNQVDDSLLRSRSISRPAYAHGQSDGFGTTKLSPFVQRLTDMQPPLRNDFVRRYDAVPSAADTVSTSFSTVGNALVFTSHSTRLGESFETDITEPTATQSTYADSVVNFYLEEEINTSMSARMGGDGPIPEYLRPLRERLVEELLEHGPFSKEQPFPGSIPLRHRYELERIGRFWDIPLSSVYKGSEMSPAFNDQDKFWSWIQLHKQRNGRALPERSPRRAWDAAVGDFRTGKQSEVVVLTGDLEWCLDHEPGIFKLKLNPLKPERTCRFHRRFGSDRFLTLTIPATARPPAKLRYEDEPTALRESIAAWLTRHDHHCLGRTWRPFYVEEVKSKRKVKAEPRFRVEFFAVDGEDFVRKSRRKLAVPPPHQQSEKHTPMSVDDLLEWHMPRAANGNQSNCKLFQRISLGLSKTYASVVVPRTRILNLLDVPGQPVMNDGCALMSRRLANSICDMLGINGDTPSAFQGRIAGAKGLWMVDRRESKHPHLDGGDGHWIEISESQLKIFPHPENWDDPADEEKLTFEVVNWAKPLHPVDLNIQLLTILEFGGDVKEYIAQLTRAGFDALYKDFEHVLKTNSSVLCRSLLQKLRPSSEDAVTKSKRLDQWTTNDAEFIIRLSEAGFAPATFYPLRRRLRQYLTWLLDRHVEELHIEVPLSTYAYCIADPYGILEPHEVHFGFSSNWRDPEGQFEDNLLDGVDVLVGRLPAHVPSDIQRRRAVWKIELRHFKDVIVFPTKGDMPLAHMLSGGDYDGDTPWICWDPHIVKSFRNSPLPKEEYSPEHFGLTKHSVPMAQVKSTEEFLQGAFEFNLTMSSLGKCTMEHERVTYDESIDSPRAKGLACLLSHLVDGRKGGVRLSDPAWRKYRKTISPRERAPPAYRQAGRKEKPSNIVDYLKFTVAKAEREAILTKLNKAFPEGQWCEHLDEDLTRPWIEACKAAESHDQSGRELRKALRVVESSINDLQKQWSTAFTEMEGFSPQARQAIEKANTLPPPSSGSHWLITLWQNRRLEWQNLLASCLYIKDRKKSFVFHTFGETLRNIKAASFSSRSVTNDILATYRVNQKVVARLTAREMPVEDVEGESEDEGEYEGAEVIESLLSTQAGLEVDEDWDDGMSVE